MILGFKEQFVEYILNDVKIHSIREDKNNLWRAGVKIHFATGVRTNKYRQFKEDVCISVQTFQIIKKHKGAIWIKVDGKDIDLVTASKLSVNDGFDSLNDFLDFFIKADSGSFIGKIIHWTDKRY